MDRAEGLAIRDTMFKELGYVKGALAWGQLLSDDSDVYNAVHGQEIADGVRIQNPGPDAGRMTDKYLRNTSAAQGDYVHGMQNPRRDPRAAAANANGKYKNNMQRALSEDRWVNGVRNYDLAEAVATATGDGGSAYSAGIQKRAAKIGRVHASLAPKLGAISQMAQAMPQDTPEQREQRAIATIRAMRGLKGQTK